MKNRGITLVTLIITIIVLLILAGITISSIVGDNGILVQAERAKTNTEISSEKEIVKTVAIKKVKKIETRDLTKMELKTEVEKFTEESVDVLTDGKDLYVYFTEKDRYYKINEDAEVVGPIDVDRAVDRYPGDITKDKDGNILTGDTEEDAYQINCIEDLCGLSNYIQEGKSCQNKYISLMRDLDFKSDFSYVDGSISIEGDIPSCNSVNELMQWLTEEEGFIPIAETDGPYFCGTFNGNYYTISNLYKTYTENSITKYGGLFGFCRGGKILNLTVEGDITVPGHAAGIVIRAENTEITNCVSKVNLKTTNNGWLGGIVSFAYGQALIKNCINYGDVGSGQFTGGILGWDWSTTTIIENSVNAGNTVNGIVGSSGSQTQIINSYNYGNCTNSIGIASTNTKYFYLDTSAPVSDNTNVISYDEQYMKSEEFVNELNNFITTDATTLGIDTTKYAKWIYKENEFPTLDYELIWNGSDWE